jgi:O-antigen ligase
VAGTAAIVFVPKVLIALAVATTVAAVVIMLVVAGTMQGKLESIVLVWILLFPLGYYYLSFPPDKPILTLDRAFVGLLMAGMLFAGRRGAVQMPVAVRRAGLAWGLFLIAALISVRQMANPLGASKLVIDAFLFPALVAWYVIRRLRVREQIAKVHALTCLMSLYVAAIGFVEVVSGRDVLELPSATFFVAEQTGGVARVNGPFSTNNSYGVIGLVSLFLLLFLGRSMGKHMPGWQRWLHLAGVLAAAATAFLPLFRSMFITVLIVAVLELYGRKKIGLRLAVAGIVLLSVPVLWSLQASNPEFLAARMSDPANLYGRIAQQTQTFELFRRSPINGVGLGNFMEAVAEIPSSAFRGVAALNAPHNNLGAILAETGLLGFLPYAIAQLLLARAFWRIRARGTPESKLAWDGFLYIFLAYWINGLSLTSGYYSDLNMWYMFALAFVYKFAVTEHKAIAAEQGLRPVPLA